MERKIGQIFSHGYEIYEVVKNDELHLLGCIDPKTWSTKKVDGMMLSVPYLRTKAGKEMDKFLRSFETTTMWDVDRLLGIGETSIYGRFYQADFFKYNDCIYIMIDSRFREEFENNNTDIIEITHKEINQTINSYNKIT